MAGIKMATTTIKINASMPPVGSTDPSKASGIASKGATRNNTSHQTGFPAIRNIRYKLAIGMKASHGRGVAVFLAIRNSIKAKNI